MVFPIAMGFSIGFSILPWDFSTDFHGTPGLRGARPQPAAAGRHRAGGGGAEETPGGGHGAEGRGRLGASAEWRWREWEFQLGFYDVFVSNHIVMC